MSWLPPDDDDDDDWDEHAFRARPNPKANRPRTKTRPDHDDAVVARVLSVDRGRYTVLVDEDTGAVEVVNLVAVDDFGKIINPCSSTRTPATAGW